jgi:glycosyltransferase involved in cell wall biosynthesis
MRIDLFFPQLPPVRDAIGEHNALLARALAEQGAQVGLVHAASVEPDLIDGVDLVRLPGSVPRAVRGLADVVTARRPDWLITAYNPFSYGARGVNPWLPRALRRAQLASSTTRLALCAHEPFSPARNLRSGLLAAAQQLQFFMVGRASNLVMLSTEVWADEFRGWWPSTPTRHFRIGSNLPEARTHRRQVRDRLGVGDGDTLLVVFGGIGGTRSPEMLSAALQAVAGEPVICVHVGPARAAFEAAAASTGVRSLSLGRLPAQAAADVLAAGDIGLAPLQDGVSPRRGSFLALLQHGLATVTTRGRYQGESLSAAASGGSFALAECRPDAFAEQVQSLVASAARRQTMGAAGRAFYSEQHDWPLLAESYLTVLRMDMHTEGLRSA